MNEAIARRCIASTLLLALAVAACTQVTDETGLSKPQQRGIVGGAAGGALVAAAAGASGGWIAGAAAMGAAVGGGVATFVGEEPNGVPEAPAPGRPTQESIDQFAALPPGSERSWSNPANADHGTVKIVSAFRKPDGTHCKRLQETMWLGGSGEQRIDATACETDDGHWQIVDMTPVATE